jgi:hypothetical protein
VAGVARLITGLVVSQQPEKRREQLAQQHEANMKKLKSGSWSMIGKPARTAAAGECGPFEIVLAKARYMGLDHRGLETCLIVVTSERLLLIGDVGAGGQPPVVELRNREVIGLSGPAVESSRDFPALVRNVTERFVSHATSAKAAAAVARHAPLRKSQPKQAATRAAPKPRASGKAAVKQQLERLPAWTGTGVEVRTALLKAIRANETVLEVTRCDGSGYMHPVTLVFTDRRVHWAARKWLGGVSVASAPYSGITDVKPGFWDNKLIFTANGTRHVFAKFRDKTSDTFVRLLRA